VANSAEGGELRARPEVAPPEASAQHESARRGANYLTAIVPVVGAAPTSAGAAAAATGDWRPATRAQYQPIVMVGVGRKWPIKLIIISLPVAGCRSLARPLAWSLGWPLVRT